MIGSYPITVTGTAPSPLVVKNSIITLNVYATTFNPMTLSTPANGALNVTGPYTFSWVADPNAATYDIDIATDAAFTNIVDAATGLVANSYISGAVLSSNTIYYWRVKPSNQCGSGSFSSAYSFTTSNCNSTVSTAVPVTISSSGTPTITSTINIGVTGTINDIDVVGLIGTHSWINDLTVTLKSPQNTTITLWDQICANENDFNLNFDDAAASATLPCPPTGGGTYQPQGSLAAFNGEDPLGTWTLTIVDNFNQDGGALNGWGLNICLTSISTTIPQNGIVNTITIYPNPTSNAFTLDLGNIENVENIILLDVQGKLIYENNNIINSKIKIDLNNKSEGIYILKVQHHNEVNTYKVVKQ
ncbi:MAG: hypothetical protein CO118_08950 [Flavobacteriales bacterium CG_4_9_14_3_um_filter_32_8]|nr:MAG: hypothetical protein CO118_08950 [Flavobacteriales bacterium CG_4_9_14_3_um_filter_32_8]